VQILCYNSRPLRNPSKDVSKLRKWFKELALSKRFEIFIFTAISLNMIVLGFYWYGISDTWVQIMEVINRVFFGIFVIEAFIKIIGLGRAYFRDGWNIFDFILLLGISGGLILEFLGDNNNLLAGQATTLRILRVARVLRLAKVAKSLQTIMATFAMTLPSLANVGFLLFLLIYIYSILGMHLFGKVKLNGVLDEHANFQTFWKAFLTLCQITTGENWDRIMFAA